MYMHQYPGSMCLSPTENEQTYLRFDQGIPEQWFNVVICSSNYHRNFLVIEKLFNLKWL
jgi:hypothetical protein